MFQKMPIKIAAGAVALYLALTPAPESHASAIAFIDQATQKFIVKSQLFFYGREANPEAVKSAVDEIDRMWNEPKVVYINHGKEYPIEFQISYEIEKPIAKKIADPFLLPRMTLAAVSTYVHLPFRQDFDENGDLKKSSPLYLKEHPEMNVIRVTDKGTKYDTRSNYNCGGQHGTFVTSDDLGISTTAAHEFGHGLGLGHVQGSICEGAEGPSIMCPRGSITLPQFQYDATATRGSRKGGTINPYKRKVLAQDIINLKLNKASLNASGYRIIGPHIRKECIANKL